MEPADGTAGGRQHIGEHQEAGLVVQPPLARHHQEHTERTEDGARTELGGHRHNDRVRFGDAVLAETQLVAQRDRRVGRAHIRPGDVGRSAGPVAQPTAELGAAAGRVAEAEPSAADRHLLEPGAKHRARGPGQAGLAAVVAHQRVDGMRPDREERVPRPRQPGRAENVRVPETGLPGRDRAAQLPAVAGDARDRGEGPVDRQPAVGRDEPAAEVADHTRPADHVHIVGRAGRPQVPARVHQHPEHVADRAAAVAVNRAAPVVRHPAGRVRQPADHALVAVPVRARRPAQPAQAQRAPVQPRVLRLQRARAAQVTARAGPGVFRARVRGRQPAHRDPGRRPDVRREPADDHDHQHDDHGGQHDHDHDHDRQCNRQGAAQGDAAAAARDHGTGHHMVAAAGHRGRAQPAPPEDGGCGGQAATQCAGGRDRHQRRHAHHRHRGRRGGVHRHTGDHHMHRAHPAVHGRVQLAHERAATRARRAHALHQPVVPVPQVAARPAGRRRHVPDVGRVLQQQLRHVARAQAVVRVLAVAPVVQHVERARALHAQPVLHTVRGRREGLRDEHEMIDDDGPATTLYARDRQPFRTSDLCIRHFKSPWRSTSRIIYLGS